MAYLVFKSDVAIKHPTSLIRAAKTESDVQLIHGGNTQTVSLVEISDEQYDSLLKFDINLTGMDGDTPIFEDVVTYAEGETPEELLTNKENFQQQVDQYKELLVHCLNRRSTHSQIGKVTSAIDYLTNLDLDSLTYPSEQMEPHLRRVGKYVHLHCI
jgi:predicted protein tyrosine phosphatase|tara:strand:+ start:397 stop:867 length:471 start_codon:yes stop_codon:yes gene_type:complete